MIDFLNETGIVVLENFAPFHFTDLVYREMQGAFFIKSVVSDHRGDNDAKEDTNYQSIVHDGRVSETAFHHSYTPEAGELLSRLTKKVSGLLDVSEDRFEPWQCTRYRTGGKFDYHEDCGNWASNERLYTVLLTLRGPDFGGETHFKNIDKMVASKAGRLLIWRNLNEDLKCDGKMLHAGLPVGMEGVEDEKMILVTWIRINRYVA